MVAFNFDFKWDDESRNLANQVINCFDSKLSMPDHILQVYLKAAPADFISLIGIIDRISKQDVNARDYVFIKSLSSDNSRKEALREYFNGLSRHQALPENMMISDEELTALINEHSAPQMMLHRQQEDKENAESSGQMERIASQKQYPAIRQADIAELLNNLVTHIAQHVNEHYAYTKLKEAPHSWHITQSRNPDIDSLMSRF